MVNLYKQSDYENALKLKKKLLKIYFICIGALLVPMGVLFGLYLSLPFASTSKIKSLGNLYLVLNCIITAIGVIFSFIYLGIPYKRARAYFKMLDDIKVGQKVKNVSTMSNPVESPLCKAEVIKLKINGYNPSAQRDKTPKTQHNAAKIDLFFLGVVEISFVISPKTPFPFFGYIISYIFPQCNTQKTRLFYKPSLFSIFSFVDLLTFRWYNLP